MLSLSPVVLLPSQMKYLLLAILLVPVLATADQDEDFLAAREAFRSEDASRLEKISGILANTPLEPYVT